MRPPKKRITSPVKLPKKVVEQPLGPCIFIGYTGLSGRKQKSGMKVRSLDDYRMRFEGKDQTEHEHFCLSKNVALFFQNGGQTAWVISASSRREALKRRPSEPIQASELIKAVRTIDSRLGFSLIAIPELIHVNATHFDKIAIELDQLCAMTGCFALLELRAEIDWKTEILRLRNSLACKAKITGFSALYGPSELTSDRKTSSLIGAISGAIQNNDRLRGIWKAPANITISGVQSLNSDLKSADLTHWTGGRTDLNVNPVIQLNGTPTIWGLGPANQTERFSISQFKERIA